MSTIPPRRHFRSSKWRLRGAVTLNPGPPSSSAFQQRNFSPASRAEVGRDLAGGAFAGFHRAFEIALRVDGGVLAAEVRVAFLRAGSGFFSVKTLKWIGAG